MSLYITNFSIPEGETQYFTSLVDFSVDITDDLYDVTTSGTYVLVNSNIPDYSLTSIFGGYRLSSSVVPSGITDIQVFAQNTNNDFLNDTFVIQNGFEIVWEEVSYWGPDKEVPISVIVNNTVEAPGTNYFSTFFKTTHYRELNLEATIAANGSGYNELGCYIKPQNKYFMYGKNFTVTVSGVKDFSGNITPPKTYSFKIEEKM